MANFETALQWMREGKVVEIPNVTGAVFIEDGSIWIGPGKPMISSTQFFPITHILSDKWEKYVEPLTDGEKEGINRLLKMAQVRGVKTHSQLELWEDIVRFAKELGVDINDI